MLVKQLRGGFFLILSSLPEEWEKKKGQNRGSSENDDKEAIMDKAIFRTSVLPYFDDGIPADAGGAYQNPAGGIYNHCFFMDRKAIKREERQPSL